MSGVSVIVDNYNYARFLPDALESVLAQSYSDFECIVVDDGSTDDSCYIIEKYARKDRRIKPVFKANGGQTSAFNAGFNQASGDIIAFLDSDDTWYSEKLEMIVAAHRKHSIVQHYLSPNGEGIYRKILPGIDRQTALLKYGYMYNHSPSSALSFTRECIAPFFPLLNEETLRGYTDGCVLMLAMTRAQVFVLDDVLGMYRIHGANLNANHTDTGKKAQDVLEMQRKFVNRQLAAHGNPLIPFSDTAYILHFLRQYTPFLRDSAEIYIYGTEGAGRNTTYAMEEIGVQVTGYIDSDPYKWGSVLLGKKISGPMLLAEKKAATVIIASSAVEAITKTLAIIGVPEGRIISLPL